MLSKEAWLWVKVNLSKNNPATLITRTLLGHYHAELHKAEAPPEDIHRPDEGVRMMNVCVFFTFYRSSRLYSHSG